MKPQPTTPQKQKFPWFKILGLGFILFIATNILIFIMSIVTKTEETATPMAKHAWVGIVLAILLTGCSWMLARLLHPATTKEALTYGIGWAVLNIALMLIVTIPNGTTNNLFGQWTTYLIYIGIAVGPVLGKR